MLDFLFLLLLQALQLCKLWNIKYTVSLTLEKYMEVLCQGWQNNNYGQSMLLKWHKDTSPRSQVPSWLPPTDTAKQTALITNPWFDTEKQCIKSQTIRTIPFTFPNGQFPSLPCSRGDHESQLPSMRCKGHMEEGKQM